VISILYLPFFVVMEALFIVTVGKFSLRLRVGQADGSPIGWREVDCPQRAQDRRWLRLLSIGFIAACASEAAAGWRRGDRYRRVSGS
jgi:hypothetical protein